MGWFYVGKHARHPRLEKAVRVMIPVLLAALLVWILLGPKLLQVEKVTLQSDALDPDVGQLRILYLSDIHYGNWPYSSQGDLNSLATRINEQKPDIVLLGGDYGKDPDSAVEFFRKLPAIRATYGTWAVLGEHDRENDTQLNTLKTVMRQRNITPVVNEVVSVRIGTKDIYLAGLDDVTNGVPQLKQVAAQCKIGDFVILLCHNPSIITQALDAVDKEGHRNWFDLGLFGHTHGGQIPLLAGSFGMPERDSDYQRGWYSPNRLQVLVSDGVGTSGLPMRIGCPPQMHLITVVSK